MDSYDFISHAYFSHVMPHLSPMNWLLVPMIMVFILLSLSITLWWQFNPCFPSHPTGASSAPKLWKWW